ncbi:hypothetical protein Tco_0657890, partial [Tanacetum coccineum]
FNTTVGNPVKKILLKLNLSDHRLLKDGSGDNVVADKEPVKEKSADKEPVDKAPVVKATVTDKASVVKTTVVDNVVADKEPVKENSAGNVGKAPVKENVKVSVLKGSLAPGKDNVKAPVKDNVEVSVLKGSLLVDVVLDDMVLNKAMGKASVKDKFKAPVKDKVEDNVKAPVKDKPKQKDNVKAPVKDKPKQKVIPTVQELSKILVLRSSNQKVKPEVKSKVVVRVSRSKETPVKRKRFLSKEDDRKKKLKSKSKKEDSDSELETDEVVDSSSDEVDRKRKKLKIKAGLKRKRSGSDCSDSSSSIDTENIKRLISKLTKKVKKQESDEESVPKKGKKKLTKRVKKEESDEESVPKKGNKKEKKLTPAEAAHEEYLSSFSTFRARTTPSSLFSAIQNSRVDILSFLSGIGFSSLHNVYIYQLPSKLGRFIVSNFNPETYMLSLDSGDKIEVTHLKIHENLGVLVGGYSLFNLDEREADHEFVRLWVGQFYPTKLKQIRVNDIASKLDLELKDHVLGVLDLHGEWTEVEVRDAEGFTGSSETSEKEVRDSYSTFGEILDFFKKAEEKLFLIYAKRVMLEEYMRKASLEYPGDGKFLALHEKYVNLFKDPISFNDDGNGDNDGDDDANDGDGNGDEEDVDEGDKDPNGSNMSFGFTKISLDDFGNDSGPTEKEPVDPTEQGTVVEGNLAEECEIISTPENYTQWLERNADLVGETIDSITAGDLFSDNSVTMEVMNTPERMLTSVSNNVFEAHCGKFIVFGIRLNLETLAPGLWLDANVIDCCGAVLNHEESF